MKKKQAIKHFGSQAKVARVLGITDTAVSNWSEVVPFRRATALVKASGGKLRLVLSDYT